MHETERGRVGQALEAIRDALSAYVGDAMAGTYGQDWADVVAEDDAKRRPNGRKWPVAKNDLAVMLKVLIHRRIEPWSSFKHYPRIRAFASEILTLRNLHAHGDECPGEHARLVDTGKRMLEMLDLRVPADLEPVDRRALAARAGFESAPIATHSQVPLSRLDQEVASLGASGEQLTKMILRATELSAVMLHEFDDALAGLDPQKPDWDTFRRRLREASDPIGAEVLELLAAIDRVEADRPISLDPRLEVLTLAARCALLGPAPLSAAMAHISALASQAHDLYSEDISRAVDLVEASQTADALAALESSTSMAMLRRVEEAKRLLAPAEGNDIWRDLMRVASRLDDADPMRNIFGASASLTLAASAKDDDGGWTSEALLHVRDAVARLRFAAGTEPGTSYESALVRALRFEGEICSDLGHSDEAMQSFARAGEIVDRYPAADPVIQG